MKRGWHEVITRARERLHGIPFVCLVLHFFKRFFTGNIVSAESDLRLGIGGILALLALPGAILPLLLLGKYSSFIRWLLRQPSFNYNTASIPDKYMLLAFTMAVTGIVTVLKWDSLFPDRLDCANLASLPAGARRIFLAKFIALLLFVGLFILALNASSAILFPLVVMGDQTNFGLWLRFVVAHAVATTAGSLFIFFFFFALVGLLMVLLPYRQFRQISTAMQFVSVIALVTLLIVTPEIGSLVTHVTSGPRTFLSWLPTVWFLGLYQQIFGRGDAEFRALAERGIEALAFVIGAAVVFYTASYGRYFRRIPEMMESAPNGPGTMKRFALRSFDRLALGSAFECACFHFATRTLVRSQRHRLLLAGYVGMGMAIAIQDVAADWSGVARAAVHLPTATLLSAPLAIAFFLLSGLRFVFNVPAELPANWAFRVVAERRGLQARRVAKKLMLAFLAPVIIVTAVIYSAIWGAWFGMIHTVFIILGSLLLTDALLLGYRKIPFTCSYAAGKHNAGMVLALYFLVFLFFSSSLAHAEHWALSWPSLIPFFVLMALIVAGWVGLHHYTRALAGGEHGEEQPLMFEDEAEPVVPSMDLR
ncbi:MAG: hypothetical protein ACYDD2_03185 [Candidatus Acidiferrales bacterium]